MCEKKPQLDGAQAEIRGLTEVIHDLRISQNDLKKENERLLAKAEKGDNAYAMVLDDVQYSPPSCAV